MVHVEVVTQGDRVSLRQRGAPDVAFTFPHRRVQAAVIGWLASDPSFGCSMSQLHDENADVEPFVLIFHEPEVYEAHFTQLDQQLFSYALADGANHEQALPAHVADVLPLHRGVLLRTHVLE
ncbi:hypothetical protein EON66_06770 [archaeon]|nr:MAG: hypothetical protein EON66_06770 [archaeon]